MGATTFEHYAPIADVRDAFQHACAAARIEYGICGYTGTLAEKADYTVIDTDRPLDFNSASQLADELIDKNDDRICDKWGPAGAIAVYDAETVTRGAAAAASHGTVTTAAPIAWLFFGWAST